MTTYDPRKSYGWNYENPPELMPTGEGSSGARAQEFLGIPVDSTLGVAAGPLLNGRWLLYYSNRGFDVLTYKTVRSRYRSCYELPNLVPVSVSDAFAPGGKLTTTERMDGTWAISFGMPSMEPSVWRRDIEWTRSRLPSGKALSVSVVATPEPDWTLDQIAEDYARCAGWAVESGADCVELNFSCPNVCSADAQLYQQPESAKFVAQAVRAAIAGTPCVVKIGHLEDEREIETLVDSLGGVVNALSMTNCIAAKVVSSNGDLFGGQPRGIGGDAIREYSVRQVQRFVRSVLKRGVDLSVVGVGGVSEADHIQQYMDAGAVSVHLATAIMLESAIGDRLQNEMCGHKKSRL